MRENRMFVSKTGQSRSDWRLLLFLGNQHVTPVIHLGLNKLGIVTLQFQLQIAFFQLENVFAHGISLSLFGEGGHAF